MSILTHFLIASLCCLVCHVFSIVVLHFISPWLNQSVRCPTSSNHFHEIERCDPRTYQRHITDDFSLPYKLYTVLNFIVLSFAGLIGSLYKRDYETEDCIVRCLRYPFTLCKNIITGKNIKWMKTSLKYRRKLGDLSTRIKYWSYTVKKIGEFQVCFEDDFRIAGRENETEVFLGLGTDGVEVAVKRLDYKFCEFAENEKKIMNSPRLVDSPHVLNYRFYQEYNKKYAYIVTSLKEETLKEFVLSKERKLDELHEKGPTIFKQILLGLGALHAHNEGLGALHAHNEGLGALHNDGILHRDLKPENILVNCEGNMVLADFGISRCLTPGKKTHVSVVRGTDKWRALESIPSDADCDKPPSEIEVRYKKESDIQTLGMVFYFVLTKGKHPFGILTFDILSRIRRGASDLTGLADQVAKDLIQWMLEHNSAERPSVEQCLKHPYISEPEEKFDLLKSVGTEINNNKMENDNSKAIQELNQVPSLTSWLEEIDKEIYEYFCASQFHNNGTELLRLIRKADAHWPPSFLQKFGTPQAYFLKVFPTLPMIVHNILRKDPNWNVRSTLKQFF